VIRTSIESSLSRLARRDFFSLRANKLDDHGQSHTRVVSGMRVGTRASPTEGRAAETSSSAKPSVKLARVYETLPFPNLTEDTAISGRKQPERNRSRIDRRMIGK